MLNCKFVYKVELQIFLYFLSISIVIRFSVVFGLVTTDELELELLTLSIYFGHANSFIIFRTDCMEFGSHLNGFI